MVTAAAYFLTGDEAWNPWPGTRHVPGKKGRINDLTKAGAFIAVEIDRRQQAAITEYVAQADAADAT